MSLGTLPLDICLLSDMLLTFQNLDKVSKSTFNVHNNTNHVKSCNVEACFRKYALILPTMRVLLSVLIVMVIIAIDCPDHRGCCSWSKDLTRSSNLLDCAERVKCEKMKK